MIHSFVSKYSICSSLSPWCEPGTAERVYKRQPVQSLFPFFKTNLAKTYCKAFGSKKSKPFWQSQLQKAIYRPDFKLSFLVPWTLTLRTKYQLAKYLRHYNMTALQCHCVISIMQVKHSSIMLFPHIVNPLNSSSKGPVFKQE